MTDVPPGAGQPNGLPMPDVAGLPYGQEKQLGDAMAGTVPSPVAASNPMADALAAAETVSPGPGLAAPSERPGEPVTAGLAVGTGPGPEVLDVPTLPRVARILDALASSTGDPQLASLAQEAAARRL